MQSYITPEAVARFREGYRRDEIPKGYSGRVHACITFGGGGIALALCLLQLRDVAPLEWLTVPLAFLYSNLSEYLGHRFPMHHRYPGLGLVFRRHTLQHHRFFTDAAMPCETPRDLRAVLFPPLLVAFFFGAFGVPVWFLLARIASANVAWLFIAVGVGYFLNYEVLHYAYHARAGSWFARRRVVRRLRALHETHHDPALMTKCNFNITYPIGDWLFGTRHGGS
jgi:hypothetical protein